MRAYPILLLSCSLAISPIAVSVAAPAAPSSPPQATSAPPKLTAAAFAAALVTAVRGVLDRGASATPPELTPLLEAALQNVFTSSNVDVPVAKEGLEGAKTTLTAASLYCPPPAAGPPTSVCQAVGQAFALVAAAIDAAAATGAIPGAAAPLAGPPATGGGGGGGGITHPPVAS